MIRAKHGGQYKQVGFIKVRQPDGTYKDVEKKYCKTNGEYGLVFEKGFTREKSGALPLQLDGIGKSLKDYTIEGNTYQSDGVSSDTPQEVVGVGERTGNLINVNAIVKGRLDDGVLGYENETTELIVSGNVIKCTIAKTWRGFVTDFIPVKQMQYYLHHTATLPEGATYSYLASVYDSQKNFVRATGQSTRLITINDGEEFIRISYTFSVTGTFEISNVMLNEGSTPLPYEPYGYKVNVVTRGKNLINIIPFKATFGTGSAVIRDFLNSLDVGAYVVSYNTELLTRNDTTDNSVYGIRVLNESGNFELTPNWSSASVGTIKKVSLKITITEDNKGKFTNVYFYGCDIFSVGVTGSANISDFQLEAGTKATEYSPYTPPITTSIYLDKPLYKIGDYADVRGMTEEVRVIKELVLTGEENWQRIDNWFRLLNSDMPYGQPPILCSHFIRKETWRLQNGESGIGTCGSYYDNQYQGFVVRYDEITSGADFKAFLAEQYSAGTPVKVYYVLATPEIKAVEPLEIPTLNGTTVIDVDTEVKPSNVYIKYKSKT